MDRERRLRMEGEPEVGEVEVVEARRRRRGGALQREGDSRDRGVALDRNEAGRERTDDHKANREQSGDPSAPAPIPRFFLNLVQWPSNPGSRRPEISWLT